MKCSPAGVRVVDAGPLPPDNREVLKKQIKKVALRNLRQMQYEAQRKASQKSILVGTISNQPERI